MSTAGDRRAGGGRKSALATIVGIDEAFLRVVAPHTAGAPLDERVKWTNLSRPKIAELLEAEGITTFAQIAKMKKADIDALEEKIGAAGKFESNDWVAQAKELAKG